LGRDTQLAQSSLRFSIGRFTTAGDIKVAGEAVRREVQRLRALAPGGNGDREPWPGAVTGEAGAAGQDTWIRFHLLVADDIVKDARFEAYGCPHTVATAAWLAEQLPGRTRGSLVPGEPPEWARTLSVPVEKLGRLLVVEDALQACLRHWP
jgi:hypothetical protein